MRLGVIVLDTLRYDTFHEMADTLTQRADHTLTEMYSTSRWTAPAHASLFTGRFPTEVGVGSNARSLPDTKPTLAEQLTDHGYRTVALSNNVHIDPYFGFTRGFEELVRGPVLQGRPTEDPGEFDWDELFSAIGDGPLRYARAVREIHHSDSPTLPTLRTGLKLFRSKLTADSDDDLGWAHEGLEPSLTDSEDLFVYANFMPCHYPYAPPTAYSPLEPLDIPPFHLTLRDEPVTEDEHNRHWQNYRGAAQYLDAELPALIDRVDWDCLFVISDHGELFGEHGLRGHEYGVYEELVHVPAIAIGSAVPRGRTTRPTSILDIHRTLLDLAGIDPPPGVRGYNLFADQLPADRAVYAESTGVGQYSDDAKGIMANIPAAWDDDHYMLRTADGMLIHDHEGTRCIDPETGTERPELTAGLQDRVETLRADRELSSGIEDDGAIPGDVEAQLLHLGYK